MTDKNTELLREAFELGVKTCVIEQSSGEWDDKTIKQDTAFYMLKLWPYVEAASTRLSEAMGVILELRNALVIAPLESPSGAYLALREQSLTRAEQFMKGEK